MANIGVIGGTGFIGKHLIWKLQQQFDTVFCIAQDEQRFASCIFAPNVVFVEKHKTKQEFVSFFKRYKIKFLVDLAYTTVPKTSFDDPLSDISSNLIATVGTFEWAKELDLEKLIWISTGGAIYGHAQEKLIDENHPVSPISPYGITKLAIEKYAYMYFKLFGLPIVCLRPSNAFGPYQVPYRGQGFIATVIASIIEGKPITIFGEKGTIRDYIYIDDLVTAIDLSLTSGRSGEVYNVGTGEGINNLDILNSLNQMGVRIGKKAEVILKPSRPFDVDYNVLDTSLFRKDTGWKVECDFEDALLSTWDWYKKTIKST
jgi:UDP-glucose 4-epimerase